MFILFVCLFWFEGPFSVMLGVILGFALGNDSWLYSGTKWDAGDGICAGRIQGKCPPCCTNIPILGFLFISRLFNTIPAVLISASRQKKKKEQQKKN